MESTVKEKLNTAVSDACARQALRQTEIKQKLFRSPSTEKPWQMTQLEYGVWISADAERMFNRSKGVLRDGLAILGVSVESESLQEAAEAHYTTVGYAHSREGIAKFNNAMHKAAVQGALRAKKEIRADVLADYPEITQAQRKVGRPKKQTESAAASVSVDSEEENFTEYIKCEHCSYVFDHDSSSPSRIFCPGCGKEVTEASETVCTPYGPDFVAEFEMRAQMGAPESGDQPETVPDAVDPSLDSLKQAYTEHLEENPSLERALDEVAGNPNRVDLAVQNIEALSVARPKIIDRAIEIESSVVAAKEVSSEKVETGYFGRREEAIKLAVAESKAAGAQHLDQVPYGVGDLRGLHIKSLRNGSCGTVVNVDSEYSILVRWDNASDAEINGGKVDEDSPVMCGDDAAEFVVDGLRKVRFDRQNDRFVVEGAVEKRRK